MIASVVVVFAELFWTPSQLLQAEDRAHVNLSFYHGLWACDNTKPFYLLQRIGRSGPLDIKYILAMDTLGTARKKWNRVDNLYWRSFVNVDGIQWPLVQKKLKVIGKALGKSITLFQLKMYYVSLTFKPTHSDGSQTKVNMNAETALERVDADSETIDYQTLYEMANIAD